MTTRALLSLPAVLALALAGCGGGGDSGPTRQEYAKQADKICQDVQRAGRNIGNPKSVAELVTFADKAEKTLDDGVQRLDDLDKPSGEDGKKAQAFVDALKADTNEQLKPALEDLKKAAQAKDKQALQRAAQRIQAANTKRSDAAAKALGATACAG